MAVDEQRIRELLLADERISCVYLLGSAESGTMRPDSDIDLAILPVPGRTLSAVDLLDLAASLAFACGRPVDPGLLSSKNLVYASQALLTGRRLFARDATYADSVVATLLGLYLRFNEDRREVVDAYRTG